MDTLWPIHVLLYNGSAQDEYGNPVPSWGAPEERKVFGWAPAGTNEDTASRQTVTSDIELFAPPDFTLDPRDRVRILGQTYEVNGRVEDFNHGPFGYAPGVRINLREFAPS